MNIEIGLIISLFLYCVVREAFYLYSTNKLLNKLMSRNYHEFAYTEAQKKSFSNKESHQAQDEGYPEDLGALTGIG